MKNIDNTIQFRSIVLFKPMSGGVVYLELSGNVEIRISHLGKITHTTQDKELWERKELTEETVLNYISKELFEIALLIAQYDIVEPSGLLGPVKGAL